MLKLTTHDQVIELQMDRPPANALVTDMMVQMHAAFDQAVADGARAIMLSGRPGMFSGGLDVPALLGLDETAVHEFWSAFFRFNRAVAGSPVPVVAAIGGHSPAGGAVIAAHCDYRIAVSGKFKIGFNEVQVGLPLPPTILAAFSRLVGPRLAANLAVRGVLMPVADALSIGLVDELVEADELEARALAWARELLAQPPVAMNTTRLAAKASFLEQLDAADDAALATEYWFSAETQAAMAALVDRLRK